MQAMENEAGKVESGIRKAPAGEDQGISLSTSSSRSLSNWIDLVLRIAATVFTLLAFSLIAGISQVGFLLQQIPPFQFILAANVLSFLYCLASLAVAILSVFLNICRATKTTPLIIYIFDTVIAVFLALASGASAGIITGSIAASNGSGIAAFAQPQASTAFSFLGTFCFVALSFLYTFTQRKSY